MNRLAGGEALTSRLFEASARWIASRSKTRLKRRSNSSAAYNSILLLEIICSCARSSIFSQQRHPAESFVKRNALVDAEPAEALAAL
jgi:hypothetical protein